MSKRRFDPETWGWAIAIAFIGLAIAFDCSGIGKERDLIIHGCDEATPDHDKDGLEAFIECVRVRTLSGGSND